MFKSFERNFYNWLAHRVTVYIFLPFVYDLEKHILTCLARLVVCVSPNYLPLVDREHQTCGGAYHPPNQLGIIIAKDKQTQRKRQTIKKKTFGRQRTSDQWKGLPPSQPTSYCYCKNKKTYTDEHNERDRGKLKEKSFAWDPSDGLTNTTTTKLATIIAKTNT